MPYHRATIAALTAILLAAQVPLCQAQQETAPQIVEPVAANPAAQEAAPPLRERKPELHYLLDASGKLVPVPSFGWEDFARLLDLQADDHPTQELPKAVIERLEITGHALADRAELELQLEVAVRDGQWQPLPLHLNGAVVLEQHVEQGELRLEPATGGGLLAWIKGDEASPVRIRLKLLRQLENTSGGQRLTLPIPRSVHATASLQALEKNVVAELPEEQGLVETTANGDGTLIQARLTSDLMQLSWRAPPPENAVEQDWLEATGELAVQLDNDGVVIDARLRLRSAGQPIEQFHITLPAGAELVPGQFTGYVLEPLEATMDAPQRVRVRLYEPNTVAEIRLQCRQDWTSAERMVDVGGLAVEEAVRQRGHVAFLVAEDVRATWEERFLVRQVEELPTALRTDGVLAGFEYSGQPFSLVTRIAPRITRLTVEPQYVVQVTDEELRLNARLRCRVRGGKLHQLQIDLGDWTLDEDAWESDGLVAVDDLDLDQTQPLTIPFSRALEGEFELLLEASRPISPGAKQITFSAPRPIGTVIAPAQLIVIAGDNIRLTPRTEAEMNLVAQRPDATVSLPASRQPPRFFRGDVQQSQFIADFEVRAATLEAEVRTQATFEDQRIDVRQVIQYRVENAPLDRLALNVPRALAAMNSLQATLVGDSPTPLSLASVTGATNSFEVVLPSPRLGEFELEIHYQLPRTTNATRVELPLVQPVGPVVAPNSLQLIAPADWELSVSGEAWNPAPSAAGAGQSTWPAETASPAALVTWKPTQDDAARRDVVERAEIYTRLVNDLRVERVTWRVTAPDGAVALRLPEGVLSRDVIARLDGKEVSVALNADGELAVRWPPRANRTASHELVIEYHVEGVPTGFNTRLAAVALASPGWIERTEWELALPEQTHLLDVSPAYAREYSWKWRGTHWERVSTQPLSAILHASGSEFQGAVIPFAPNGYALSAFGPPQVLEVTTASRSGLVLFASSLALAIGLTLLLIPALRRAEFALALVFLLIVAVAWLGDAAILLAQAAVPGVVAVVTALVAQRIVSRRRPATAMLQGSTHLAARRVPTERHRGSSVTQPPSTSRATPSSIASEAP